MKSFFAALFGTVVGLALFFFGAIVVGVGLVVGLANIEPPLPTVEQGSYLVVDLTAANLTDTPPLVDDSALGRLLRGASAEPLGLRAATSALKRAATDGRVKGVYITGQLQPEGYGSGLAGLREFRAALAEVRAAGKPVRAWFEMASTLEFYLAAGADELAVDPFGLVLMPGLSSEPIFVAGALERFGVGVQVTRSGKYKAAVEPFLRKELSPESREQLQVLLDDLWKVVVRDVAEGRGLTTEALQALVDREGLISPQAALEAGLISRVAYHDEILADLKEATARTGAEAFAQIDLRDYAKVVLNEAAMAGASASGRVAVVYAEGAIVDGEGAEGEVGGAWFSRELRTLREDPEIAAIVVRVNSPGGSASASEQILRELKLARETKPVVVSLGNYAASGGYWIAMSGGKVFTEEATITGSIGVFGLQLDVRQLANDLGITWDSVKTARYADSFTVARPKTEEELAIFQRLVDWTYDAFLQRVSEARGLTKEQVHELAQGRVWSGVEAVKHGLADEIGGLGDAIAHAAGEVGLTAGDYEIVEVPRTRPLAEALAELFDDRRPQQVKAGVVSEVLSQVKAQARILEQFNDPRGIYARMPLDVRPRLARDRSPPTGRRRCKQFFNKR